MEYVVSRLDLDSLDAEKREDFALLTEPHLRHYIREKGKEIPVIIAIGAFLGSEPVGLILGLHFEALQTGYIRSLYVARGHRRQKIGTRLFEAFETEFRKGDGKVLTFTYRKEPYYGPGYEAIFTKREWSAPKLYMEQYLYNGFLARPQWAEKKPKISTHYKIFPWRLLKQSDREIIEHEYEQGRFHIAVDPFFEEEHIEKMNSLGLRHKKEVVGWVISHRISLDVIRYTSIYVRPELQFTGVPLRLMYETIKLHRAKQATIKWAVFLFNIEVIEPAWRRFIKKRFAPIAQACIKMYKTSKTF